MENNKINNPLIQKIFGRSSLLEKLVFNCICFFTKIKRRLIHLFLPSAEQRVKKLIKNLVVAYGIKHKRNPMARYISLKFTYMEIATHSSTGIKTVRKVFQDLQDRGIIENNRNRLLVWDIKARELNE